MARPRSDDKRNAIIAAAIRVIAAEGPGVATATIAKEGGVSNGSLFTYFETKADLFNQLYLELKAEMAAVALDAMPIDDDARAKMRHVWMRWVRWATERASQVLDLARGLTMRAQMGMPRETLLMDADEAADVMLLPRSS